MVMMEKKMMSPFNRLSKQSKQKTIQARYLVFATLIGLFVISSITTNQSSNNIRGSIRTVEDLKLPPTNATIVSDIREVLDLVDHKSDSSGISDEVVSELQMNKEAADSVDNKDDKDFSYPVAGATNVHEEGTDSPEEVSSQEAAERDDDIETSTANTKSTTDNTLSLQERLLARSIEVRDMISETLTEAAEHIPSVKYFHFNPQYKEERPTDHSCDQEDAYAGVAVGGWLPPLYGYPAESLNEWFNEYELSTKKIKNKDAGGSALRDFAAKESQKLRELRHSLFCED